MMKLLTNAVRAGGDAIRALCPHGSLVISRKEDGTEVTNGDLAISNAILAVLGYTNAYRYLFEDTTEAARLLLGSNHILPNHGSIIPLPSNVMIADPADGTRDLIEGWRGNRARLDRVGIALSYHKNNADSHMPARMAAIHLPFRKTPITIAADETDCTVNGAPTHLGNVLSLQRYTYSTWNRPESKYDRLVVQRLTPCYTGSYQTPPVSAVCDIIIGNSILHTIQHPSIWDVAAPYRALVTAGGSAVALHYIDDRVYYDRCIDWGVVTMSDMLFAANEGVLGAALGAIGARPMPYASGDFS